MVSIAIIIFDVHKLLELGLLYKMTENFVQFSARLTNIYLFDVNNRYTRKRSEVYSKLKIKRYWHRPGVLVPIWTYFTPFSSVSSVFINFEQVNVC